MIKGRRDRESERERKRRTNQRLVRKGCDGDGDDDDMMSDGLLTAADDDRDSGSSAMLQWLLQPIASSAGRDRESERIESIEVRSWQAESDGSPGVVSEFQI
jgi:hypothetical protein